MILHISTLVVLAYINDYLDFFYHVTNVDNIGLWKEVRTVFHKLIYFQGGSVEYTDVSVCATFFLSSEYTGEVYMDIN